MNAIAVRLTGRRCGLASSLNCRTSHHQLLAAERKEMQVGRSALDFLFATDQTGLRRRSATCTRRCEVVRERRSSGDCLAHQIQRWRPSCIRGRTWSAPARTSARGSASATRAICRHAQSKSLQLAALTSVQVCLSKLRPSAQSAVLPVEACQHHMTLWSICCEAVKSKLPERKPDGASE